jgi:hypothetical protein
VFDPSRRRFLTGSAALLACPAWAQTPARLHFSVFHNGMKVGDHELTFDRSGGDVTVATRVRMTLAIAGLLTVSYAHVAREHWTGGRFQTLETRTDTSGKIERVSAKRTADGISVDRKGGTFLLPADALPLTHWNPQVFSGPIFNPQNGKIMKVTASRADNPPPGGARAASSWMLSGESQVEDWYDAAGVWTALRGRLPDRSTMEYRQA